DDVQVRRGSSCSHFHRPCEFCSIAATFFGEDSRSRPSMLVFVGPESDFPAALSPAITPALAAPNSFYLQDLRCPRRCDVPWYSLILDHGSSTVKRCRRLVPPLARLGRPGRLPDRTDPARQRQLGEARATRLPKHQTGRHGGSPCPQVRTT